MIITIEDVMNIADDDPRVQLDNEHAAAIPENHRCEKCEGTGNQMMFMYQQCSDCRGTGIVKVS